MLYVIALVVAVIMVAIISLIGALILMLATKLVAKVKLGYGKAYGLTFIVYVINAVAGMLIMMAMGVDLMAQDPANQSPLATHNIIGNVVGFLIGAWIFGSKITEDSGTAIGFGKGAAISLVMILIAVAVGMALLAFTGGAAMMGGAEG